MLIIKHLQINAGQTKLGRLSPVFAGLFELSGRVQKGTGGSSKGDKSSTYVNSPLVEGLRRPERSGGRRRPSTKGESGLILHCEKNNWPNVSPTHSSKPSFNSLTTGKSVVPRLATSFRSAEPSFTGSALAGCTPDPGSAPHS